jgi:nitrate reductase molybdenum cofactor assembly chaperone NarJ/NarW
VKATDEDLIRKLVEEGPPAEEVGLTPYGEPAFDARLEEARATTGWVSTGSVSTGSTSVTGGVR